MKIYNLLHIGIWGLFIVLNFSSCADDYKLGLNKYDSIAPSAPEVTSIDNSDGESTIHYTVPDDGDMLYVVATYHNNASSTRTTKVSVYDNQIKVQGFDKAGAYDVELRSVDRSNNMSEPVKVTVNPTEPPYLKIFSSLKAQASWSGLKLTWQNPSEANIILSILRKDSTGAFVPLTNVYSNSVDGSSSIHGFTDTIPQNVQIYIRDRYDNYSSKMDFEFTPWKEKKIGKSKMREVHLPGDMQALNGYPLSNIWDGIYNDLNVGFFHGNDGVQCGKFITFDLGDKVQISRYRQFQRMHPICTYGHNNIKTWVMYGCSEITDDMRKRADISVEDLTEGISEDGAKWKAWIVEQTKGWTELDNAKCYRPSGRDDIGNYTQEDYDYIIDGDEHEIDISKPPVRYIRMLLLTTWGRSSVPQISEIDFYGQVVK